MTWWRCGWTAGDLDRPGPPHVVPVLDEQVLHRLIGSAQVMADQLAHLAGRCERPDITVRVLFTPDSGRNRC